MQSHSPPSSQPVRWTPQTIQSQSPSLTQPAQWPQTIQSPSLTQPAQWPQTMLSQSPSLSKLFSSQPAQWPQTILPPPLSQRWTSPSVQQQQQQEAFYNYLQQSPTHLQVPSEGHQLQSTTTLRTAQILSQNSKIPISTINGTPTGPTRGEGQNYVTSSAYPFQWDASGKPSSTNWSQQQETGSTTQSQRPSTCPTQTQYYHMYDPRSYSMNSHILGQQTRNPSSIPHTITTMPYPQVDDDDEEEDNQSASGPLGTFSIGPSISGTSGNGYPDLLGTSRNGYSDPAPILPKISPETIFINDDEPHKTTPSPATSQNSTGNPVQTWPFPYVANQGNYSRPPYIAISPIHPPTSTTQTASVPTVSQIFSSHYDYGSFQSFTLNKYNIPGYNGYNVPGYQSSASTAAAATAATAASAGYQPSASAPTATAGYQPSASAIATAAACFQLGNGGALYGNHDLMSHFGKKRIYDDMRETDQGKEGDDRSKLSRIPSSKLSVYDLIQMELVAPGDKVTFKREEDPGELTAEGNILYREQVYTTLSAFARNWNQYRNNNAPSSHNGWDVVYCRGHPMKYYKSLVQSPDFIPPCCPFSKTKKFARKDTAPLNPILLVGDAIGEEWRLDQKSTQWHICMAN